MKTPDLIEPPATAAAVRRAYQPPAPSPEEEKRLIEEHLPLVRSVVERLRIHLPPHVDAEELHSVGIVGLVAAVRNCGADRRATFAGYAVQRIRGAILDELRRLDWRPRSARARARQLRDAQAAVEQRLGRPASDTEIRRELGLDVGEYEKWLEAARPVCMLSFDDSGPDDAGGGGSLHDVIADDRATPVADEMERRELVEMVAKRIEELPEIQRKVLAMYYHEEMRLAEIAEVFGLTESRICQIHSQAILSLRAFVRRARES